MDRKRDENLMIAAAVEGYSFKHNIAAKDVFDLFDRYGVFDIIRSQYDTLHTQSLDESVSFAEDVLASGGVFYLNHDKYPLLPKRGGFK